MTLIQLKALYKKAKKAYYNGNSDPIMTDAKFDKLEDMIRKADPSWAELGSTGVKVDNKKTEVELPHFMPSLNKKYPEAVDKWLAAYPADSYLVMEKLDGSSLQVVYEGGKPVQVITRGDGTRGGDISFLIPNLKLKNIKDKRRLFFRCEAVMSKKAFKKWESKFDNARNLVNGILNRKEPHPALKDVDIIVLGIFDSNLLAGFVFASSQGMPLVSRIALKAKMVDADSLTKMLEVRKQKSEYAIDGLVIAPSSFAMNYDSADKRKDITAFKVNSEDDTISAVVKSIVWQVSGRGRIVPKIEIKPTEMDGVTVTYCAAHNAKWMEERGIGPGAIVRLVRSGGVIPKIVGVTKGGKASVPDIDHKWDGVHYVVSKADDTTAKVIQVKRIHKFMTTLGVELLASKTIAHLYESGFKSVKDYILETHSGKVASKMIGSGLGFKQTQNIVAELERVFKSVISVKDLMVATQIFGVGIGVRKLKQIEDHGISMSDLLKMGGKEGIEQALKSVRGFDAKTISVITRGYDQWASFYSFARQYLKLNGKIVVKAKKAGSLSGQFVSFTGYRSADHEQWVQEKGGEVISFGSKTTILLYKEGGRNSSKVESARSKGIKTLTFDLLVMDN